MSANAKELIFEEEARQKLFSGMKKLADVVACTLGPEGRMWGLKKAGAPHRLPTTEVVLSGILS